LKQFSSFLEIERIEDEEVLPLEYAQTKLEQLLEPENAFEDSVEHESPAEEIDTLDAHAELIRMKELLKAERDALNDQVREFF
jgi:hypothetical protein